MCNKDFCRTFGRILWSLQVYQKNTEKAMNIVCSIQRKALTKNHLYGVELEINKIYTIDTGSPITIMPNKPKWKIRNRSTEILEYEHKRDQTFGESMDKCTI